MVHNDYFVINSFRVVLFLVPSSAFVLINTSREYLKIVRRTMHQADAVIAKQSETYIVVIEQKVTKYLHIY